MKNFYIKLMQSSKALAFVIMTMFFAFSANAQITTPQEPDPTNLHFINGSDTVQIDTTGIDFSSSTVFYLHTGTNATTFTSDDVIASSADTTIIFQWDYRDGVANNYYVTPATNFGTNSEILIGPDSVNLGGNQSYNASGLFNGIATEVYEMESFGFRRLTTEVLDLSTTDDVSLFVDLDVTDVSSEDSLLVEFSIDGTTWLALEDVLDSAYFSSTYMAGAAAFGVINLEFELPASAKNANSRFRIIQGNRSDFVADEDEWFVNAETFKVSIGSESISTNGVFVNTYTVSRPSTGLATRDADNIASTTFSAGDSINIDATFTGFENQVTSYDFSAILENGDGEVYRLSDETIGTIISDNDLDDNGSFIYSFSVSGFLPKDLVYGDDWDVTIEAYSGSTPTLGADLDLLGDADFVGYDNVEDEFDEDGDRSVISEAINIESVTSGTVFLELEKTSLGFSPSGTEIVLEYTTDGSTFIQIGNSISLNDDLSEVLEIDVSGISSLISSSTQFRVKQSSNSGVELDTWDIETFSFFASGTLLEAGDPVNYNNVTITIDEPTISLDPVDVPDGLIYPGDMINLTYNITEGELVDGTTITAIFEPSGSNPFVIGTSTLITPGDSEDHIIEVEIPTYTGGNYTVQLFFENSFSTASSNSVNLPIYGTSITVNEVTSNSGVTDGGVDVIYPGDMITVDYTLDGEVGTGAELMLEVYDYSEEVDDFVVLNSETGSDIDGTISGTLPAGIDYDDNGNQNATIRLKIGDGILATSGLTFAKNEDDDDANAVGLFTDGFFDALVGNYPVDDSDGDYDNFIGAGERSATTLAFDYTFGGSVTFNFDDDANFVESQMVYVQGSIDDGATWVAIGEEEYTGAGFSISELVPAELWSSATSFRFIYNEDNASDEFDNEIELLSITLLVNQTTVANSTEYDISSQFRKPTVSLEVLDSYDFITGEQFTIEYTTEGTFPANTAFAIVMEGPDNLETVVGTSTTQGLASVDVTMPAFAFEDNPIDTDALYDQISVVAFDQTNSSTYTPDETIVLDDDSFFLVIEGTDDNDGDYYFNEAGDRSLLTDAFDLSSASEVSVDFTIANIGVGPMDNLLTLPVFQVSIDGGETFTNVAVEEDGMLGDGYIFNNQSFSADIPSGLITNATHFRWYQPLNLGANTDQWRINGISVTLVTGNEISTFYTANNSGVASTLAHPDLNDFAWEQENADTDPVFNGEDFTYSWDQLFETSDDFPAGTQFDFILHDGSGFVIDPETNRPYILGSTSSLGGALTASVPFYVEEGSYSVRLIASVPWEDGETYFFAGDENGESTNTVGSLDVFLRAVRTTFDFDENDVFYAGNTATFTINLENDDENTFDASALYANLLVKNFSGGDDLILATQLGIGDITVDMPPYIRGTYNFEVQLSENAPIGEVGDLTSESDLENLQNDLQEEFINAPDIATEIVTRDFYESQLGYNTNERLYYTFDYVPKNSLGFRLYYSLNGGAEVFAQNWGSSPREGQSTSYSLPIEMRDQAGNDRIKFIWRLSGADDGSYFNVYDVDFRDLTPVESDFTKTGGFLTFENTSGRGLITTRDFEAGELDNSTLISFDLTFEEVPENMSANQFLIFEYSTDGGSTYTELQSFPDADLEIALDNENFLFSVTDDMKENDTRFRWRQEERNSIFVEINNVSLLSGEVLPFEYVDDNQTISNQVILVSGISSEEACQDDDIVIDYEIRGRMGADNIISARYQEAGSASNSGTFSVEVNATSGNGQMTVNLPSDVFADEENNKGFRFGLAYDDDTNVDYNFSGQGPLSELQLEVVAPINASSNFTVNSGNNLECESEDVTVNISSPINYFMYEILNEVDGSVLGTLTYDPEVGDSEINLGPITEDVTLRLQITSKSSEGLECNSLISTITRDVNVLANYELNVNDDGSGYVPVEAGDSKTICVDASSNVTLRVYRPNGNLATSGVEWFRNDLNNPVNVNTSYEILNSELSEAGSYFARVTDGSCTYITESFVIENIDTPSIPEITVTGDLGTCDGDGEVVLEATAGFTYYSWSNGEETQQITVDEEGSYSVTVSNVPFEVGCSVTSEAIELETTFSQEFTLRSVAQGDFLTGGETVNDCDATTIQFYNEDYGSLQGANGGLYTVFRDGVPVKTTTGSSVSVKVSGEYYIEWTNDALNGVCTTTSPTFNIVIFESVTTKPTITVVSGDLLFCEGDGEVILSAPEGFNFYEWSGGNVDGSGAREVTATEGDSYTVRVSNLPFGEGCASPSSAPVVLREASSPEFFVRTDTDGNDENNIINEGTSLEECDSEFIYFFENNSYANNGTVVLFRDGVEYAQVFDRFFEITESGSYTAEKRSDDINISCVRNIGAFTVTINEAPTAVPVLTATGDLSFCTNEGNSVLLTAPAGFAVYNWFRNGGSISSNTAGFDATSNTLEVIENGTYSVQVGNVANCYSPVSNIITVSTKNLPGIPGISQSDATCGPGPVTFSFNGDNLYSYQLINALTGQASGNPVVGGDSFNSFITSESISEETPFYLEVSYADGSGCSTFNEFSTFTGEPNNVNLELDGNTLRAVIANYSGYSEIRWFRNGTLLKNQTNTTITITDAAEYSVEVDFEGAGLCTVTSNAIDLSNDTAGAGGGAGGIQGSAYPNPASGVVNVKIEGENMGDYDISIMTLSGQLMMSKTLSKEDEEFVDQLDIQSLQPGIYNLLIRKGNETKSMRIVKTQ